MIMGKKNWLFIQGTRKDKITDLKRVKIYLITSKLIIMIF